MWYDIMHNVKLGSTYPLIVYLSQTGNEGTVASRTCKGETIIWYKIMHNVKFGSTYPPVVYFSQ